MIDGTLEQVVLGTRRFRETLETLAVSAVVNDLEGINLSTDLPKVDWSLAILSASALTRAQSIAGRSAALRVVHSGLELGSGNPVAEASALLLERIGNSRSIHRAVEQEWIRPESWSEAPTLAALDVIARRLELTVDAGGEQIAVNEFQREFWDDAEASDWLSVSAPTSAGKSYILKRWIAHKAGTSGSFRALYVVPTRALIEEVSADLIEYFGDNLDVEVMPWRRDPESSAVDRELFVLTQERVHLLLRTRPDFVPDLVVLDEAQKFDDRHRGVLLQQVLDELVERGPNAQVIFASPLTSNPEILLEGAPAGQRSRSLASEVVTVNQNLIYASEISGRDWSIQLVRTDKKMDVGSFRLNATPNSIRKRLALVAVALGGSRSGNVVYADGPGEAEAVAALIADALGTSSNPQVNEEIASLMELSATAVHPNFALSSVLKSGVAFHYGTMPQIIRAEIERLFKEEQIKYLVCTSTLLEGVNLPCRNVFVRGPHKGKNNPMKPGDFWNLAGRAGRWGKEFQGNIVCIDTDVEGVWETVPSVREKQVISRAVDGVMSKPSDLLAYAVAPAEEQRSDKEGLLESVLSLVSSKVARGGRIDEIVGLTGSDGVLEQLQSVLQDDLETLPFPQQLLTRHAGISPRLMTSLYKEIESASDPSDLVLPPPTAKDARQRYFKALTLVSEHLRVNWGNDRRRRQIAGLVINWMKGKPLPVIINGRVKWKKANEASNRPKEGSIRSVIRSVLEDVERVARYEVPKFLSCYQDLVIHRASAVGVQIRPEEAFDISLMLELGVSRDTEISMMSMGISRTAAVELGKLIVDDDLTPHQALDWIRDQDVEDLEVPRLVIREITSFLGRRMSVAPAAE
ncbi:DEAD/DEAH box helicase [Arthrobacter koreensis]|uniref:DEAD/DEAH box helicase n=1 Tax=Arthrobacter koreensis TaxID=199136 RepID=UPI00381F4674